MKRPVLAAVAGLAVLGMTAAGAYVIASPGGEEEAVQQVETTTPSPASSQTPTASPLLETPVLLTLSPTVPGGLPPAAEGYVWYETPRNGAFDYGLPLYAVQVPTGWTHPGGFYDNPAQFYPPGTTAIGPILTVLFERTSSIRSSFLSRIVGEHAWVCASLPGPSMESAGHMWELYSFACPVDEVGACKVVDGASIQCEPFDPTVPISVYRGRGGMTTIGDRAVVIWIRHPDGDASHDATFDEALKSFVLQ